MMADTHSSNKRKPPDIEIQVAAAALTAAISPPLGIAVAAGSALRSRRVRQALRKGTVNAVAGAMQLGDQIAAAAAARTGEPTNESDPPASEDNERGSTGTSKS
jgi:hypothetical protein